MKISIHTDEKALLFTHERLGMLLNTLEISEFYEYQAIITIAKFTTLLAKYSKGFKIIFQPNPWDGALNDPLLTF